MKLNQLTIEELVELRTQMILEKKSTSQINQVIDKKELEYAYSIVEDSATGGPAGSVSGGDVGSMGLAYSNAGIGGMGAVVSAQPSSYAGSTIGNNWSGNGGTVGSGDISNPFPGPDKMYQKTPAAEMGKGHGARTGKKSRVKKLDLKSLRNALSKKQDYTASSEPKGKRVMNFDDFQKQGLSKVTKVKESLNQINQREIFSDKEIVGNCPECECEITNNDVYTGSFFCTSCGKEGKVYELDNLNC